MGIIEGTLDGWQPICSSCGIALCYELSNDDYMTQISYWNNWECEICNPEYFNNWKKNRRKEHDRGI